MRDVEGLMQEPVDGIMVRNVIMIRKDQTLEALLTLLREKGISGVPVIESDGTICGIVTEYDVMNFLSEKAKTRIKLPIELLALERGERLNALSMLEGFKSMKVSEIMKSPPITAPPTMKVRDVVALMVKHEVNRIPIVDKGKPVGIITREDIIRALSEG